MADEQIRSAVKIVDPTTAANQMAVNATGAGLVDIEELPNAAALADGMGNPTTTLIGALMAGYNGTTWDRLWAIADGDTVVAAATGFLSLGTDGSNYQVISVTSAGLVNIAPLPTGTNEIGDIRSITTSVTPGVAAANLGKARAAAGGLTDTGIAAWGVRDDAPGYDGSEVDGDYVPFRFDSNGRLHVADPNAGGGGGSPTNPVLDVPALANIGPFSSAALDTANLGAGGPNTHRLSGVDVSSSAPFKAEIVQVDNDVEIIKATQFGKAGEPLQWRPAHKDYTERIFADTVGFDGWRVNVTNLDTSETTDFYVGFYYED